MKLSEIRKKLDILEEEWTKVDEGPADQEILGNFYDFDWEYRPLVPYEELPSSLQKAVRERLDIDKLKTFLQEMFPSKEEVEYLETLPDEALMSDDGHRIKYSTFEQFTEGFTGKDLDNVIIRTRKTAKYTLQYAPKEIRYPKEQQKDELREIIPYLYGNFALEAFGAALEYFRNKQKKRASKKAAPNETNTAKLPNAGIVNAGKYQLVISDKDFRGALSSVKNSNAYVRLMDSNFFERISFEEGVLKIDDELAGIIKEHGKKGYDELKELDLPLLTQIYTATAKAAMRNDAYTITVDTKAFFAEMGINTTGDNAADVMEKLHSFERCIGIIPKTKFAGKLFSIIAIDPQNQTMTFAAPYILRIIEMLNEKNHVSKSTRAGGDIDYVLPYHNSLVHSTIASERNKAAVELVYRITTGVVERGTVPDVSTYRKKKTKTNNPDLITYTISFRSLINSTFYLRGRIASYKNPSDKNKAIKRAFKKAYELLVSKTDLKKKYVNVTFSNVIPTMNTLDIDFEVKHEGERTEYKPQK